MVNPFTDQRVFMEACDQSTNGIKNEKQYALYRDLIKEEIKSLDKAEDGVVKKLLDCLFFLDAAKGGKAKYFKI